MQIRNRLTFQFLAIVATILFCSLVSVYYLAANYRKDAFYIRLKEKAITYANVKLDASKRNESLLEIINRAKKDAIYREYVIVFDSTGKEIYPDKEAVAYERPPWLELITEQKWIEQIKNKGERRLLAKEYEIYGMTYMDEECQEMYISIAGAVDIFGVNELSNLRNTLTVVFVVVVLATAIAGWVFAGRALYPISKVINQLDMISPANLNQRLEEPEHKDEIYRLTSTFNKMLGRIENAFIIQKNFVANASHELKNMLTVITSQLEVSQMKPRTTEEYQATLGSVLDGIRTLNEVSHRLLELARISGDESLITLESIRIDEVIWHAREDVLRRGRNYKVQVVFHDLPDDEEHLIIKGNEALLRTALVNLMENACKFSPQQEVFVTFTYKQNFIVIDISDNGIGIPAKELPYIFEPFYRANNTRNVRGHGIGLSLVARIIKIHNAVIDVKSEEGKGTNFKIVFVHK